MITEYLLPEFEARVLADIWFHQEVTTCQTAREIMALLRQKFDEPVNWPPR